MADWEVIYKATADFESLTRTARDASADLKKLQADSKAESDTEVKGADTKVPQVSGHTNGASETERTGSRRSSPS